MGDGGNIDSTFGILAMSIAECFGSEAVSVELASSLTKLLPQATFLRASIRCGTGLFVTDDLLRPGYSMVSLVSLKYSLAGLAMKQGTALTVRLPPGSNSFGNVVPTRIVACVPAAVAPPQGTAYRPLQIGALLVGSSGELTPELKNGIARLATASGPALLTIGLGKVQHLSHLLSLRDADAEYIGAEEDLQDLPLEVARPHPSAMGPPTQPLDLGRSTTPALVTPRTNVPAQVQAQHEHHHQQQQPSNPSESVGSFRAPAEQVTNTVSDAAAVDSATESTGDFFGADNDDNEPPSVEKAQFFRDQGFSSVSESVATSVVGAGMNGGAWVSRTGSLDLEKKGSQLMQGCHHQHGVPTMSTLLCFQDNSALESTYIAAEAHARAISDAAFCGLYLIAVLCLLWTSAPVPHPAWLALALSASLPLAASLTALAGKGELYARCREALLAMLLLVPVVLARRGGPLEGVGNRLDVTVGSLPCLLRSADVLLSMVFPLGCRVRFCWLLPGQMVNMWSIFKDLPWGELRHAGCVRSCAVVLTIAGAFPLILTYACEMRARQRLVKLSGRHHNCS